LIGELGKVNTNDHLGGQHEATLLNTWIRAANLRRWINRPNCPAVLREFYRLFTRILGINLGDRTEAGKTDMKAADSRPANYQYDGVHYSRSSTHLGNSLVIHVGSTGKTYAGSIEEIVVDKQQQVVFKVRWQAPLPKGKNDPFRRFTYFPATTYSSKMSDEVDVIHPSSIVGHYARFEFSEEQAVVLNLSR
ncbi:hypothetical protein C8F04DRAFT_1349919, partial [Mycena alexandri]